jgi:hypothetical protein
VPLAGDWRQARPAQRFGYVVGGTLVLVGLAHLAAWLVLGGAWQGPISFRKPTTSGSPSGCCSVHSPPPTPTRSPLVAVQRWRGVASHFNFATPWTPDSSWRAWPAIAVTVTVIVALAVLSFMRLRAAPSMAVAVRAGLLILLVAQGSGGWMIGHGVGPASDGVTQGLTTFGAPNRDYREEPTSKAGCWGRCG